jgi:hypothetical protein
MCVSWLHEDQHECINSVVNESCANSGSTKTHSVIMGAPPMRAHTPMAVRKVPVCVHMYAALLIEHVELMSSTASKNAPVDALKAWYIIPKPTEYGGSSRFCCRTARCSVMWSRSYRARQECACILITGMFAYLL